jgi:hypothetical protein
MTPDIALEDGPVPVRRPSDDDDDGVRPDAAGADTVGAAAGAAFDSQHALAACPASPPPIPRIQVITPTPPRPLSALTRLPLLVPRSPVVAIPRAPLAAGQPVAGGSLDAGAADAGTLLSTSPDDVTDDRRSMDSAEDGPRPSVLARASDLPLDVRAPELVAAGGDLRAGQALDMRMLPVALAQDFHMVAEQIFVLWHQLLTVIAVSSYHVPETAMCLLVLRVASSRRDP